MFCNFILHILVATCNLCILGIADLFYESFSWEILKSKIVNCVELSLAWCERVHRG